MSLTRGTVYFADVRVGNIENQKLTFAQKKFDYILFGDVLEHLRDPEATLRYCRELLSEEGRIVACIPNLMYYTVLKGLINGNFTYTDTGLLDRTHIHFFTYKEIVSMFENVQLQIEDVILRGTPQDPVSEEDSQFVEQILRLSDRAEKFMFYAFQYIVSAKK